MKKLCIFTLMVAFLFASAIADDDPPPRNKPATVTIITNPPNSDVYLGNELLGKSPIENKQVMSGRQTLIVIDQGYELVNQRVNVWQGNDKRNTFDYGTKIPKGNIEVTTSRASASSTSTVKTPTRPTVQRSPSTTWMPATTWSVPNAPTASPPKCS